MLGEVPCREIVEDDPVSLRFEGQADRLGLTGVERRVLYAGVRGSPECPAFDPGRKLRQGGGDFALDGWRDHDLREKLLKKRKLIDLDERDEHARVGYDDRSHQSMDAFSAAQSSLVIWK